MAGTFFSAPIAMMWTPSHRCSSLIFAIISAAISMPSFIGRPLTPFALPSSAAAARRSIILRHGNAGDVFVHVARHARRLERNDASHDVGLDASRVDLLQKALERIEIKNALRLDEAGARLHLLAELVDLQEHRLIDRRDGCAL